MNIVFDGYYHMVGVVGDILDNLILLSSC